MNTLGIDPGKDGGMVLLSPDSKILRKEKPFILPDGDYDDPAFLRFFQECSTHGTFMAVIEVLRALPSEFKGAGGKTIRTSPTTNFERGISIGFFRGLFAAMSIPHQRVQPKAWQREMLGAVSGRDAIKAESVKQAVQLWPSEDWRISTRAIRPNDGYTDAALLAEYGRRKFTSPIPAPAAAPVVQST